MAVDQYSVRIVQTSGTNPDFHIDHDARVVTYLYRGDIANLVLMAQRVGQIIAENRLVPVIPAVE